MAIVFREFAVPINRDRGTWFSQHHITFPASQRVNTARVALTGFTLDFENPEGDRSLNVISVILNIWEVTSSSVDFVVSVQLADKNFDDEYRGVVGILMIADISTRPTTFPGISDAIGWLLRRLAPRRRPSDVRYEPEQLEVQRKRPEP
jgi:hypothetical protein